MDKFNLYIMRALTNMHAGSGDINYNIIDNEVQRDVITNYPNINSSSLKGSLKEYFRAQEKDYKDIDDFNKNLIEEPFGSDNSMGHYKFFSANLLSIPVRSNVKQFFRATCPKIIDEFLTLFKDFNEKCAFENELSTLRKINIDKENPLIIVEDKAYNQFKNARIECMNVSIKEVKGVKRLEKLFGEDIVLLNNEDFDELVEGLPVIARNHLENGESKNLWYEEVVPRESRFYFGILQNGDKKYGEHFNKVLADGAVHIGANATIGYGYTKIFNIQKLAGDKNE